MTDYLIRILAKEARVRGLICVTTAVVNEANRRHNVRPPAGVALGRLLTGGVLLGALLKVRQRVAVKIEGDGPLHKIVVEADSYGRVRGYISVPQVDLPLVRGQYDIPAAIGRTGYLTVVKDLHLKQLAEGVVPLSNSTVAADLQAYFDQSEQIPTIVGISEVLAADGRIATSGGLLLQEMPSSGRGSIEDAESLAEQDEAVMALLQERVQELPPVADLLHSGKTPEAVAALLFADIPYEVLENRPLRFQCDCSWERTRQALILLGRDDIQALLETEGQAVITCHFCHETYVFDQYELEVLLMEMG